MNQLRYVVRLGLPVAVTVFALVLPVAPAGAYTIPPPCKVPNVVGKADTQAALAIYRAGCKIGNIKDETSSAPRGQVIAQTPKSGSGPTVDFTVSIGKLKPGEKCTVPHVVGKSRVTAIKDVVNANCDVGKITQETSSKPAGEVIAQSPAAGHTGRIGTYVDLTVSKGKKK
jgi:serine/threonine-protein kinase